MSVKHIGQDWSPEAFGSAVSFLMAWAESQPDGENAGLFPPHVAEWAARCDYELTNLSLAYNLGAVDNRTRNHDNHTRSRAV